MLGAQKAITSINANSTWVSGLPSPIEGLEPRTQVVWMLRPRRRPTWLAPSSDSKQHTFYNTERKKEAFCLTRDFMSDDRQVGSYERKRRLFRIDYETGRKADALLNSSGGSASCENQSLLHAWHSFPRGELLPLTIAVRAVHPCSIRNKD